jgi:hypothetical protein
LPVRVGRCLQKYTHLKNFDSVSTNEAQWRY